VFYVAHNVLEVQDKRSTKGKGNGKKTILLARYGQRRAVPTHARRILGKRLQKSSGLGAIKTKNKEGEGGLFGGGQINDTVVESH